MIPRKVIIVFSVFVFLLFVLFSYFVAKETYVQIDFDTTVKFQDHISRGWDLPFSLLSILGSAEITGLIWLCLVLFFLIKRHWLTFLALSSFVFSSMLEIFGKVFVLHPGPPHLFYRGVLNVELPSHYVHTDYSYPSGHLTRTAFLISFLIVYLYLKVDGWYKLTLQAILLGILILMAVSRIYLGEHWTSDVIGGLLLGSSLGIFSAATIPTKAKLI